jgi:hypothetical protein
MDEREAKQIALQILKQHMPDCDFLVESEKVDVSGICNGKRIEAEVKAMGVVRIDNLLGFFSLAILHLRRNRSLDSLGVVLVGAERVGAKARNAVEEFMYEFAPELGWGLFDRSGGLRLRISAFDIDVHEASSKPIYKPKARGRLFSDLNRWMWKILLLSDSPPANFPRHARSHPQNPMSLSQIANVSHQKGYEFARDMEDRRYLRRDHEGFHPLQVRELLEEWVREDAFSPAPRISVRRIFPGPPGLALPLDNILLSTSKARIAVGGFEASSRLGLIHASYSHPEVHIEGPIEAILHDLDVEICEPRDADFNIIRSPHSESVFRGAQVRDRVPIVDALQAALDVAGNPARGLEQAEYIVERIARWASA